MEEEITLIQGTLDGNQAAQKILYDKYRKIINDYIKCKYSNCRNIEDDVSEIIIKVFLNLEQFDILKAKFKSWVISIANNHMIDKWRSSNSSENIVELNTSEYSNSTSDCNSFISSPNLDISMSCSSNFEIDSSIGFLSSQISPSDFTLLNMKYVQGYNYCEIGREFNVTSNTISNKVNYIKSKLKKSMNEEYYN